MSYGSKEWQDWVLEEEEGIKHIKVACVSPVNFLGSVVDGKGSCYYNTDMTQGFKRLIRRTYTQTVFRKSGKS